MKTIIDNRADDKCRFFFFFKFDGVYFSLEF